MSDCAAWISAGAAVVSVGAAIWATAKGAKAHKASLTIQARLAGIEEARERDRLSQKTKAKLRAVLQRRDPIDILRIINDGDAAARSVVLTLDGVPFCKHPALSSEDQQQIPEIGPQSSFDCPLVITFDSTPPTLAELTWEDGSGVPGRYRTGLSF